MIQGWASKRETEKEWEWVRERESICVYVCVCVCVWKRERERGRWEAKFVAAHDKKTAILKPNLVPLEIQVWNWLNFVFACCATTKMSRNMALLWPVLYKF